MLLKVRARDLRDLEDLVLRRISAIPAVERVRTSLAMSTQLERPVSMPVLTVRAKARRTATP